MADQDLTTTQKVAGFMVEFLVLAFLLSIIGSFLWQVIGYAIRRAS